MKFYDGEYACRMVSFPGDVHGATRLSKDGTEFPNIYINDWLAPQARRQAFDHEIAHLENDDFHNEMSIDEVEGCL